MCRALIGCIILCMLSFAGRAGLKDTTYFDMEWQRTTKEKAFYYRLPVEKEGNRYRMRDYYMSGTLQMDGLVLRLILKLMLVIMYTTLKMAIRSMRVLTSKV